MFRIIIGVLQIVSFILLFITLIVLAVYFIRRKKINNAKKKIIRIIGVLIAELLLFIGVNAATSIQSLYGVDLDLSKQIEQKDNIQKVL